MATETLSFDLVVLGSGPGGQRAALQGAKAGKKVALLEQHPNAVGGGCIHTGTIPSKSFRESVYRYALGSRGSFGIDETGAPTAKKSTAISKVDFPDMERLLRRRDRVVSMESQVVFDQLTRNKITVIHGRGRLVSGTEVEVTLTDGALQRLTCQYIFVAVGARPVAPAHLQMDGKTVLDSNSILNLKRVPRSMVVLGAGIIGCEYASCFAMAGTKVFLVDRRHEILASVDREIVNHLVERFTTQDMELVLGCEATEVTRKGKSDTSGLRVRLSNNRTLEPEVVLISQGRFGNTDDLGLDKVGVERDERGLIKVDRNYRTAISTVYAVGDVIGAPALASTSMEQGRIACCHAFKIGSEEEWSMPQYFPYGIYTIPEISILGKTEEDLMGENADFVAGRARYRELARGQIVGDRWGLLKLMVDRKSLKLLGVHIIGDNAADLIHIGQAVMAFGGDVNYFIRNVFNYPTLAEAYKTAAFHAVNQIRGTTTTR